MSKVRSDNISNRADDGSPKLVYGAEVPVGYGITGAGGINITGIATAASFSGNVSGATGTFTGNVSIGGTLTYEDVTNIDSVGIITARSDISIADKIVHTGDTNTAIRFPAVDTFTVETAGSERVRVTSDGNVRVPDNGKFTCGAGDDLKIYHNGSVNYLAGNEIRVVNNAVSESMAKFIADGAVELYHNDIKRLETSAAGVTVTGTVSDSIGPLRRLGVNAQGGAYAFVVGDAGKIIRSAGSGAALTLNQNIFTAGDMISVFNVSGGANTVVQGTGVTMYNTADAATGTRTIAAKGMVTIVCTASNEFAISGSQLS